MSPAGREGRDITLQGGTVLRIRLDPDRVGVLTKNVEGQKALTIRRLSDGEEEVRFADVDINDFIFVGQAVVGVSEDQRRVHLLGPSAGERQELWPDALGFVLGTLAVEDHTLWVPTWRDGVFRILKHSTSRHPESGRLPTVAPPEIPCARKPTVYGQGRDVVLVDPDQPDVYRFVDESGNWASVGAMPGALPLGVWGGRLFVLDETRRRLFRIPTDSGVSGAASALVYESQGTLHAASVTAPDAQDRIVLLELSVSKVRTLVSIPLSGSDRPHSQPAGASMDETMPGLWSHDGTTIAYWHFRNSQHMVGFLRLRPEPSPPTVIRPEPGTGSGARAVGWLLNQLGPVIASVHAADARLIDSYEDTTRAGWTYDAAVAAIAFVHADRIDQARSLLAGLAHLQQPDGSWYFSYDPDRGLPFRMERYVGTMAWVVMAANYYEAASGDSRFADMARRGLGYILRFQGAEGTDVQGGFSMGPNALRSYSIEHNVDCYSAFLYRGRLDGNQHYLDVASRAAWFVLNKLWREDPASPEKGYFKVGFRDPDLYLDAQTWTALAFEPVHSPRRLRDAVDVALARLRTTSSSQSTTGVEGFADTISNVANRLAWAEGTEGMVAALYLLGRSEEAAFFHSQTGYLQWQESGGIPYAAPNDAGWTTAPSVAATAWFVLNDPLGANRPGANPFVPPGFRPPSPGPAGLQ